MRQKYLAVLLCCNMVGLAACQHESCDTGSAEEELSMSVVARIGNVSSTKGRYAGADLNNAEFTTGDAIGIFTDEQSVVCWNYESLGWAAEVKTYWPDKEDEHVFRAFYPYTDADSYNEIPMPSLQGQIGNFESVSNCDFLIASTTQSYGESGVVSFQGEGKSFQHISSLIQLQIKSAEDLSSAVLNKLSLAGTNLFAPSTYSFTDGVTLSPDGLSDLLTIELDNDMSGGDVTLYLVVNEKKNTATDVTLTLEYTVDGQAYTATKTGFANNTFTGGMQQSYTLTVMNRTLVISGAEISPWEQGNELEDIIIESDKKES